MNRDRVIIVAIICMTIIFIASTVSPAGSSGKTGAGFQMETVKTGYIVWMQGETGVHTCRVYDSLDEAVGAAHSKADFHHRPYEVRTAYESPARTIKTINPRRRQ